ncbi:MAG: hypothetical protein ACRYHA_11920 [Janthinobacterium lividum]
MPKLRTDLAAIHFDTLWASGSDMLAALAGKIWTDRADHDPGITVLQSLAYAVSDLSYRHLHDLPDILASHAAQAHGDAPVFPPAFAADRMLASAPVTLDDYRRALLDLVDDHARPLFRNVRVRPCASGDGQDASVNRLAVDYEPSRPWARAAALPSDTRDAPDMQNAPDAMSALDALDATRAEQSLAKFFAEYRTCCEAPPVCRAVRAQAVDVGLTLMLEDDCLDPEDVFARIFLLLDELLSPKARYFDAASAPEERFDGPPMRSGWIAHLPPDIDYSQPDERAANLSNAALGIGLIVGVRSLVELSVLSGEAGGASALDDTPDHTQDARPVATLSRPAGDAWIVARRKDHFLRVWPDLDRALDVQVCFVKGGQRVVLQRARVEQHLEQLRPRPMSAPAARLSPGRARALTHTLPVRRRLPPVLGLASRIPARPENAERRRAQRQLLEFLLPFEKSLIEATRRLAGVGAALRFDAVVGNRSAPPLDDARAETGQPQDEMLDLPPVYSLLHDVATSSLGFSWVNDATDALLAYFGAGHFEPLRGMPVQPPEERAAIRRRYLAQLPAIDRDRPVLRIGEVSALQKRIAARLSIDGGIFSGADPVDFRRLPFFIVDYVGLYPERAQVDFQDIAAQTSRCLDHGMEITFPKTCQGCLPPYGALVDIHDDGHTISVPWALVVRADEVLPPDERAVAAGSDAAPKLYLGSMGNHYLHAQRQRIAQAGAQATFSLLSEPVVPAEFPLPAGVLAMPAKNRVRRIAADYGAQHVAVGDRIRLSAAHPGSAAAPIDLTVSRIDEPRRLWFEVEPIDGSWPSAGENWQWSAAEVLERDSPKLAFQLGFVFRRRQFASVGGADSESIEAGIRAVVRDELPLHLDAHMHVLDDVAFDYFSHHYAIWQGLHGGRLGTSSHELMRMLGLGQLPREPGGIGTLHVDGPGDAVKSVEDARGKFVFHVSDTENQRTEVSS